MSFNTLTTFFKQLRAGTQLDPERDWFMFITLSLIAFAVIVVWNISTFDTITSGGVIGTSASNTTSSLDSSSLNTIRTIFINRAAEEMKYQTGTYRFSDPSQ